MILLKDINKSFSGVQVLFGVSAAIEEKKVTAVIGENGAGKSTLMNILSGAITDYSGKIILGDQEVSFRNTKEAAAKGITIIHQELNIFPDLTAAENIFLGREPAKGGIINYSRLFREADKILAQFRFPYPSSIRMRRLSVGWQQIVEIARAISLNTKAIIMDEPTSALSDSETEILFEKIRYLKDEGKTILFISHRISEVLEIADNIIVMRDGRISALMAKQDTSREELIRFMAGEKAVSGKMHAGSTYGTEILSLENVSVQDRNMNLSDINFTLHKGEVLGVAGLLGSGRTELLKFIYGEYGKKFDGKIFLRGKKYTPASSSQSIKEKIIYLPENRKDEGIFADHSLLANASISVLKKYQSGGILNPAKERRDVGKKFGELNVKMRTPFQKIRTLSGGNQQKVLLSRILLTEPHIILMDDPARGIDINSKEEIYTIISRITEKGIGIIFTSSEIPELLRICSRVLVLSGGKQTALLDAAGITTQEILNYAFKQL